MNKDDIYTNITKHNKCIDELEKEYTFPNIQVDITDIEEGYTCNHYHCNKCGRQRRIHFNIKIPYMRGNDTLSIHLNHVIDVYYN